MDNILDKLIGWYFFLEGSVRPKVSRLAREAKNLDYTEMEFIYASLQDCKDSVDGLILNSFGNKSGHNNLLELVYKENDDLFFNESIPVAEKLFKKMDQVLNELIGIANKEGIETSFDLTQTNYNNLNSEYPEDFSGYFV